MIAEKIFKIYDRVRKKPFKWVTNLEMNILFNVSARAKRDEKYAKTMEEFDTGMGDSLVSLIDKFFEAYNTSYGLDIRDSLVLYEDDNFSGGCYFDVQTYREKNGELTPHAATEFTSGETAVVKFEIRNRETDQPINVPKLGAVCKCGDEFSETTVENSSKLTVKFTLDRPGHAFAKIAVFNEDGRSMPGCDPGFGGVLFDKDNILSKPVGKEDIERFWRRQIERMLKTDPLSEVADGYSGRVKSEFDMPSKNKHGIRRFDSEYLELLREAGYTPPSAETLETHDSYEIYLKAPGPCHASAYLTIPKSGTPMPIHITYDGYSAYMPMPVYSDDAIRFHCTHHGYELAKPSKGYYQVLSGKGGICESYGRNNGAVNSDYTDPADCYMTYLWLRNLQAFRYITTRSLSGEIPGLHECWNGEIILSGGSMGGYQAAMMAALAELMHDCCGKFEITLSEPSVPAMCNTCSGWSLVTNYVPEIDYYDPAQLAHLIKCGLSIERAALGDESCPIPGIVAFYNNITNAKWREIRILQNSSHGFLPEEENRIWYIYKS